MGFVCVCVCVYVCVLLYLFLFSTFSAMSMGHFENQYKIRGSERSTKSYPQIGPHRPKDQLVPFKTHLCFFFFLLCQSATSASLLCSLISFGITILIRLDSKRKQIQ